VRHPSASASLLVALLAGPAVGWDGVAYVRTVEGYAEHTFRPTGGVQALQAAANTPLAAGDRLSVAVGARLEAVLADGSRLRLGGGTELLLTGLAGSFEGAALASALELPQGELQVTRPYGSGPEALEVGLGGATAYLEAPGVYRLSNDGAGTAWVTVREGFAEVAMAWGSATVRAAQTAWLPVPGRQGLELTRAFARDELELWADELDAQLRLTATPYVDESLAYAAVPLAEHGGWFEVSGRYGWQPYAAADWRPYAEGRWTYAPGGLAWVAAEPWGWVTSHYGAWDYLPGFGWIWFPGELYAPAWVYWYWGPTHVGWIPAGIYLGAYASYGYVPWPGVYGWVGGTWGDYGHWTFCRVDDLGHPGRRFVSGSELAVTTRGAAIPRGLLATDTRALTPEVWHDLDAVKTRLLATAKRPATTELPDVTRFAVGSGAQDGASRWFEPGSAALRRAIATRSLRVSTGSPSSTAAGRPLPTPPSRGAVLPGSTVRPLVPGTSPQRFPYGLPPVRQPVVERDPGAGAPPAAGWTPSAGRPTSGLHAGRSVVQRVLEDIRAGRSGVSRAPAGRAEASARPPQSGKPPSRPPASRRPPRL
jgi:hypothetical protein